MTDATPIECMADDETDKPSKPPQSWPSMSRTADDVLSILFGTTISLLALVYIAVSNIVLLVAWEAVAILHLVLVFARFRSKSLHDGANDSRVLPSKAFEYLSWVFPIAASVTGVASAVTLLTTDALSETGGADGWIVGLLGAIGVIVAWGLLQTGFAEIYETQYKRLPEAGIISFPGGDKDPTMGDLLFMSFTIGTSFGAEGATIASPKVRRVILIHSITSFFYNAFLIAIAIQVLQGIIARG